MPGALVGTASPGWAVSAGELPGEKHQAQHAPWPRLVCARRPLAQPACATSSRACPAGSDVRPPGLTIVYGTPLRRSASSPAVAWKRRSGFQQNRVGSHIWHPGTFLVYQDARPLACWQRAGPLKCPAPQPVCPVPPRRPQRPHPCTCSPSSSSACC